MGSLVNAGLMQRVLKPPAQYDVGVGQPVYVGKFETIVNGSHPVTKPVGKLNNRSADVAAADHDKMGLGHENLQVN